MSAAPPARLGPPELVEVADHVFAYVQPDGSWWINTPAFVVGPDAVVSIDTCSTERRTRAYRDAIRSVTAAPVTTVVNTHHHGDHTYGNGLFSGAAVVGHRRTRSELLAAGPARDTGLWDPVDWGQVPLTPPTITFDDAVTVWSGDRPLQVRHVGRPAHTTNDSTVWLEEEGVLFCGDLLFQGGTPFLLMGSVAGALQVLTEVLAAVPARVVVAGHGRPSGPELVDTVAGYLRWLLGLAEQGRAAGLAPLELAREADLGPYAEWLDAERVVGNLHRAYCDLEGEGREPDLLGALQEMITWNGGRPLACYA